MNKDLHLPNLNPFLPDNFAIKGQKATEPLKSPSIVVESPLIRLWHKLDDQFLVPKGTVSLSIKSDKAYSSAENCVLTALYTELLLEELNEYTYYAEIAGLDFDLTNTTSGLNLNVSGFTDKIQLLLRKLVHHMAIFKGNQQDFDRIKALTFRNYTNWFQSSPSSHASYFFTCFTQEVMFTTQEKLDVLESITLEKVLAFYPRYTHLLYPLKHFRLFQNCRIEGLVHGNFSQENVIEIKDLLIEELKLDKESIPINVPEILQTVSLPDGMAVIFEQSVFNPSNLNSAISFGVQLGNISDPETRGLSLLTSQIIREPVFNHMRTKQQLGTFEPHNQVILCV